MSASLFSKDVKTRRFYVLLILWAAGFVAALMPFSAYDAHSFFLSFLILCLALGTAVLSLPGQKSLHIPKSLFLFFLCGFWLIALISVICSDILLISYVHFCFLSTLPLSFILCLLIPGRENFFRQAGIFAAFVFAVLSLFSLLSYFIFPQLLSNHLVHLPMANPNSLAGFLSLGFFCAYGAMMAAESKTNKVALFILALLILGALFITGSRGALLALLFGMAVLALSARGFFKPVWGMHVCFVIISALIFIGLTQFAPESNTQTPGIVLEKTVSGDMSALGERDAIWASTWQMIQDHFWTGTGPGTFFLYYPAYRGADFQTAGHAAHNDPLQFWAEMGAFAPLLFYLALIAGLVKTIKALKTLKPEDEKRMKILAPFCGILALVIHAHITFHFYTLANLFLTGSLLAYWFAQTEAILPSGAFTLTKPGSWENDLFKLCVGVLLICVCFLFVSFKGSILLADHAKNRRASGDMAGFITYINASMGLSLNTNGHAQAMASTVPSRQLVEHSALLTQQQKQDLFTQADMLLSRAIKNHPRLASAYHEKAVLHAYGNEFLPALAYEDPVILLKKAVAYDPLDPKSRVVLADMLLRRARRQEALDVLTAGLIWPYKDRDPMPLYKMTLDLARIMGDENTVSQTQKRAQNFIRRKKKAYAKQLNLRQRGK